MFLIVDGHPSHRARKVFDFIRSTGGKLQLFFLPPYSPELNPDEWVWNHLKNHGIGNRIIDSRDALRRAVMGHLHHLQKTPRLIRAFFQDPNLRYVLGECLATSVFLGTRRSQNTLAYTSVRLVDLSAGTSNAYANRAMLRWKT